MYCSNNYYLFYQGPFTNWRDVNKSEQKLREDGVWGKICVNGSQLKQKDVTSLLQTTILHFRGSY